MQCPKCSNDLSIYKTGLKVTGDESPDTETKVVTVMRLVCRNPVCDSYYLRGGTEEQPSIADVVEIDQEVE
jgi:hypothetical protein